jgi:hypothetical protein
MNHSTLTCALRMSQPFVGILVGWSVTMKAITAVYGGMLGKHPTQGTANTNRKSHIGYKKCTGSSSIL